MRVAKGNVSEVFGSFQGEGPHVGERHIFVRLCSCNLSCLYCDTSYAHEKSPFARIEAGPGGRVRKLPNPISVETALEAVKAQEVFPGFNSTLCVTGGEPLMQPAFVGALLDSLDGRFRVMLETNGTLTRAFNTVKQHIDIVSMDIKLPSSSRQGALWKKHAGFLAACADKEVVVKVVVAGDTPVAEVAKAARLVSDTMPGACFIIQPVSATGKGRAVPGDMLLEYYTEARGVLENVRVIPQTHKLMGVR